MSRKDVKGLIKWAEEMGWTAASTKRHVKFIPPFKHQAIVYCPSTPSDHRSIRNVRAQIRKEMRNSTEICAIKHKSSIT